MEDDIKDPVTAEADKILPQIVLKLRKLWAVNFTKRISALKTPSRAKRW